MLIQQPGVAPKQKVDVDPQPSNVLNFNVDQVVSRPAPIQVAVQAPAL